MTISRTALQAAAFWDQSACLECGHTFTADEDSESPVCPACGGQRVYDAGEVLGILESVEEEEE